MPSTASHVWSFIQLRKPCFSNPLLCTAQQANKLPRLMVIENFLPTPVASAALAALQCAPATAWDVVEAKHDVGRKADGAGSTQHRYSCMGETRVHGDGDMAAISATSSSTSGEPKLSR